MSQKQRSHSEQYHYVNTMGEFPEDDDALIPSNTTPIEQLGIELLGEVKTPDGEDEGEDETVTPEELKIQFFKLIADLQRKFPGYTSADFKKYLEDDVGMAEQLQTLKDNFRETFRDTDKEDAEYINLLIGLSSIGVEIPKDEGDECADECADECEDEGDDALAKSIIKIDLEEMKVEKTVTDV